nr:sigma-E processing peptidase SpoIIGA [uncultured Oscillibacter sp.]
MTVIYIDSVFALNALMDYLLLLCAARLAGLPLRRGPWPGALTRRRCFCRGWAFWPKRR